MTKKKDAEESSEAPTVTTPETTPEAAETVAEPVAEDAGPDLVAELKAKINALIPQLTDRSARAGQDAHDECSLPELQAGCRSAEPVGHSGAGAGAGAGRAGEVGTSGNGGHDVERHDSGCRWVMRHGGLVCTCETKEAGMNLYQVAIVGGTTLEPELVFGIETLFAQDETAARQTAVQKAVEAGKKFDAGKVRVIVKAFA